jgi:hypothetical protein
MLALAKAGLEAAAAEAAAAEAASWEAEFMTRKRLLGRLDQWGEEKNSGGDCTVNERIGWLKKGAREKVCNGHANISEAVAELPGKAQSEEMRFHLDHASRIHERSTESAPVWRDDYACAYLTCCRPLPFHVRLWLCACGRTAAGAKKPWEPQQREHPTPVGGRGAGDVCVSVRRASCSFRLLLSSLLFPCAGCPVGLSAKARSLLRRLCKAVQGHQEKRTEEENGTNM